MRINIPNTMADVTLGQYQEFCLMLKMDLEDATKLQRTIEIFCGIQDARSIELESIANIEKHIANMLSEKPSLTPIYGDLGFIPNMTKLTLGELIDLENYLTDEAQWHKAMAVMFRKVTHKFRDRYAIKKYKGATEAQERKALPLDIAMGGVLFFWSIARGLVADTLPFMPLPMEMETTSLHAYRPIVPSLLAGDGIKEFSNWHKETSQSLTR